MAKAMTGLGEDVALRTSRRSSPAVLARPVPTDQPQMAALADIAPNPRNPQARSVTDVEQIAASVAEIGVIAPVLLTSVEEWVAQYPDDAELVAGHSWVLQDGHRRFAAAQLAGVDQVPFVRRGVDIDETVLRIATAYHSRKLTALEEAVNFAWLVNHRQMTQQQISSQTGVSQTYIANRLRLLTLPAAIQAAVDQGALALDAALRLGRNADPDLVVRVGTKVAEKLDAPADPESDADTTTPVRVVPQLVLQDLINEAEEARRVEDAMQRAQASAADLGGQFVADIKSQFPGTHRTHRLQNSAQIERAAAKGNLLVAPASFGVEPEFYAKVLERNQRGEETNREELLRAEAAAARMEALKRAVQQDIPGSLLQDALVRITLAGLGLTTGKAGPLAYRLAAHAGLAPDTIGDWAWRSMLPSLSADDQTRAAWIIALASIERLTEPAKAAWGPLQQWYYATLSKVAGYTPTDWEQARLDTLRKDAR